MPVAPWSDGPVETLEEAREHAERIGFPLMIKAAAGGGGRGIRRSTRPTGSSRARRARAPRPRRVRRRHRASWRRWSAPAHHIEVQLIADGQGTAWAVGRARLLAASAATRRSSRSPPAPCSRAEQEDEVKEAARRLALRAGYRNAGTVEFLYEPAEKRFSFMEVNARLQVEHPVTEAVTGLDLVKLQLHVAAGGRLEGEPPAPRRPRDRGAPERRGPGARLRARARAASQLLASPTGPGVRVDRGIAAGDVIPPDFDSMIAKVIAYGRDRDEALARLRRALRRDDRGHRGRHDQPGLPARAARPPRVRAPARSTRLARPPAAARRDRARAPRRRRAAAGRDRARRRRETAAERARFYAFARRGRPQADAARRAHRRAPPPRPGLPLAVSQLAPGRYRVDGRRRRRRGRRSSASGAHERRITIGGAHAPHADLAPGRRPARRGRRRAAPHLARRRRLRAQPRARGRRRRSPCAEGDEVAEGDVVAVVECDEDGDAR